MADAATAQVPEPGQLSLDHVAHFVPDVDAASAALERVGFTLTPFSAQSHRLQPEGPLVPAGTGNRCVMFERGYVEFLTPTADTPIAEQLRSAISRYIGVHLIAFGTSSPEADHERLSINGFEPLPPVALQRPISTESGEGLARFTVVRVPSGVMAEGRIQYCHQRTPELVWQHRWLNHPNGATALAAVLICTADPGEAAARYSRFSGVQAQPHGSTRVLRTARGTLHFIDPTTCEQALGLPPPTLPWIAGYGVESRDLAATRELLSTSGVTVSQRQAGQLIVPLPQSLGGVVCFTAPGGEVTLAA